MKRFVSVLLTAIMIFFVFSLSGFAQNTKAEEYYEKIVNTEEITVKVKSFNYYDNEVAEQDIVFCRKGDSISLEFSLPPVYDGVPFPLGNAKIVLKDEKAVLFFTWWPFFSVEIPSDAFEYVLPEGGVTENLTCLSGEEKTINGELCFVENYTDEEGNTAEYIFVGNELKSVSSKDPDGNIIAEIQIEEISYSVAWYQFLTPFITIDLNDGFIDIDDLKISGIL